MGVVDCPSSFFACLISATGGVAWGMRCVIHGGGVWRNIAGQGRVELQLNSIQLQYSPKRKTQPAFFALSQDAALPRVSRRRCAVLQLKSL
jgi:hypothetical protein